MASSTRKNKRVADSDDGDSSDGRGGQRGDNSAAPATDRLLVKVDPEYLNTPIDVRQGDAKIRAIYGNLVSFEKTVRDAENILSDVAAEMAEMLGEQHRDEEYNENVVFERLQANVSGSDLTGCCFRSLSSQPAARGRGLTRIPDVRAGFT